MGDKNPNKLKKKKKAPEKGAAQSSTMTESTSDKKNKK